MAELEKWTAKLTPYDVLDDNYDGRTASGMRKALARMETADEDRVATSMLANFEKLISALELVKAKHVLKLEEKELDKGLTIIEEEGIAVPPDFKKQLLHRRAQKLKEQGQFMELIKVMNPFGCAKSEFRLRFPTLSTLPVPEVDKAVTYNEVVMQSVVIDLIKAGSSSSEKLLQLARDALSLMEGVDLVEVEDVTVAKELGDHITIWRALVAVPRSMCRRRTSGEGNGLDVLKCPSKLGKKEKKAR